MDNHPGAEMKLWVAIAIGAVGCAVPALAREPMVLAVGNNRGNAEEELLRYAEVDAQRFADVLVELGGVRRERTFVLQGASAEDLELTLRELRGRAGELHAAGHDVTLYVYFAGHGDERSYHLGDEELPADHLKERLQDIGADLTVVIVDACRSSGGSRWRGPKRGPSFNVKLDQGGPRGMVTLSAASPGEPAQESDRLGGAVFTHYLLSGLRGGADFNGDSQVTLEEVYAFAHGRTLLRTTSSTGSVQHPDYRVALAGSGPVVLSTPSQGSVTLTFPPEEDTRYYVFSLPSSSLVAEVPAKYWTPTQVGLPSGRYVIHKRGPKSAGVAQIDRPWGGKVVLENDAFTAAEPRRLVLRGGHAEHRESLVFAHFTTSMPVTSDGEVVPGVGVTYGRLFDPVLLHLDLEVDSFVGFYRGEETGEERRVGLTLGVSWMLVRTWFSLRLGGGLAVDLVWQELKRARPRVWRAAGLDPRPEYLGVAFGPQLGLGFSVALIHGFSLDLSVKGRGTIRQVRQPKTDMFGYDPDNTELVFLPVVQAGLGVSYAF